MTTLLLRANCHKPGQHNNFEEMQMNAFLRLQKISKIYKQSKNTTAS